MLLDVLSEHGLPKENWDEVFVNRASQWVNKPPGPNSKDIDFRRAINGSAYYSYTGSLTIPPCEQNVAWYVRKDYKLVSDAQLEKFRKVLLGVSPPRGNYRNIQPLNDRKVKVMTSTDLYDPEGFDPVKLPKFTPPGPPPLVTDDDVIGNPDFNEIKATDSPELRAAKKQVMLKNQNFDAARAGAITAAGAAAGAQKDYDDAPGPVMKIDLAWKKIKANRKSSAANVGLTNARNRYGEAVDNAKAVLAKDPIFLKKKRDEAAAAEDVPVLPTGGTIPPDNNTEPTSFPPRPTVLPGQTLKYEPELRYPRGIAANPFIDDPLQQAEDRVRIGDMPGLNRIRYERYSANLRQPDGPIGQFPVPPLVKYTTTTTTTLLTTIPPTGPPVIEGSIEGLDQMSPQDARAAVAKSLNVTPGEVELVPAAAASLVAKARVPSHRSQGGDPRLLRAARVARRSASP